MNLFVLPSPADCKTIFDDADHLPEGPLELRAVATLLFAAVKSRALPIAISNASFAMRMCFRRVEVCTNCGVVLKALGEHVTEELEYVPGRLIVNRIVRPRLVLPGDLVHRFRFSVFAGIGFALFGLLGSGFGDKACTDPVHSIRGKLLLVCCRRYLRPLLAALVCPVGLLMIFGNVSPSSASKRGSILSVFGFSAVDADSGQAVYFVL